MARPRLLDGPWRRLRERRALRRRAAGAPIDVAADLPDADAAHVVDAISTLLGRNETALQRTDAATIAATYLTLDDDGRRRFLDSLARIFWTNDADVDAAARTLLAAPDPIERRHAARALRGALTPASTHLLHLFTGLDSGVKFLVDLRADLLRLASDEALADLDSELKAHLATLFDVGLLTLRRITWDAPAALLEKLIEYEAVHAIDSWADLKNRLDSDRRCFAFFHPAMPDEPLVFVEIALTLGITRQLGLLLDEDAPETVPETADTAVFYSISSCQPGLAGVNLGNALIKQVVEELGADLPNLSTFVTLSPLPGYRAWLEDALHSSALRDGEQVLLPAPPERLVARLGSEEWSLDESVRPFLLATSARYLTTMSGPRVIDPVANFHLANGACLAEIDWAADESEAGYARSIGMMANYLYEPDRIPERAEAYLTAGEVAISPSVRDLLVE